MDGEGGYHTYRPALGTWRDPKRKRRKIDLLRTFLHMDAPTKHRERVYDRVMMELGGGKGDLKAHLTTLYQDGGGDGRADVVLPCVNVPHHVPR